MKSLLRLLSFAMLLCVLPLAHADDLNGTWKGTFDYEGSPVATTLNLKIDGAAVTGTVEGLPTSPTDIHDGKLDGNTISFWVNTDYQGDTYKLVFKGTYASEQINFDFGTDDGSWGTSMSVKRDAAPTLADITGTWKGSFDLNGTDTPVTFNLKSTGATVTGTVTSPEGVANEIHDGKIDGNTVTFWLTTDYQGQTYTVQYTGKISTGQIDFTLGLPDGSWGSEALVKKS